MTTHELSEEELGALIFVARHSATGFAPGGGSTADLYFTDAERTYGRAALAAAQDIADHFGCGCPTCRELES